MYESEILDVYRMCNVRSFPIDCEVIVRGCGFDLVSYKDLAKDHEEYKRLCLYSNDAFTSFEDRMICYNNRIRHTRIRFSLMHEIGHCVLQTDEEDPADTFAANILAPPAIILAKKLQNADEISRFFGLSVSAANNAVRSIRGYNIIDGADLISYFRSFSLETDFRSVPVMQKIVRKRRSKRMKLFEEREAWILENVSEVHDLAFRAREREAFFPFG